jgi:hypothetical protein
MPPKQLVSFGIVSALNLELPAVLLDEIVDHVVARVHDEPARRYLSNKALAARYGVGEPKPRMSPRTTSQNLTRSANRSYSPDNTQNAPAARERPGAGHEGVISVAGRTLSSRTRGDTGWKRDGKAKGIYWRRRADGSKRWGYLPTERSPLPRPARRL